MSNRRFSCYYYDCEKEFRSKIYLVTHINKQHLKSDVVFCGRCKLFFPSEHEFALHEQVHIKETKSNYSKNYLLSSFNLSDSFSYVPPNLLTLPVLPGIEEERKSKAFSYKLPISVKQYDRLTELNQENIH